MAGHSKWATTKRHKAAIDAKKGKAFSVISKDLTMAARNGGGDPEFNPRLRTIIAKAKAANMPADNVDRAIKKGTGELPGVIYEELVYECYAPGGVGLIVEVTTDNKNRSAMEVRSNLTKQGGNMAQPGALAHSFARQGQFIISHDKTTEEQLMEVVLEAGAEDIKDNGDHFEVLSPLTEFDAVADALGKAGIEPDSSELAYIPSTLVPVTEADAARKLLRTIDILEELDDVQKVYANFDIPDELMGEE